MRKLSREEWIYGAFDALAAGGIDALRVEPLAAALRVTKGSFYHHFENRRALHLAMLDEWERSGTELVIVDVDSGSLEPSDRLLALASRAFTADPQVDRIETGIRAWAITDDVVAAACDRVDERRIDYVVGILRSVGFSKALATRRARLLYRVMIGDATWRTAGGPASSKKEVAELIDLLLTNG